MLSDKLYIAELKALIERFPKTWANLIHGQTYRHIYDDVLLHMPKIFENVKTTYSTKAWCYLQENSEHMEWPKCAICGKNIENINASIAVGFKKTCNDKSCRVKQRSITNQQNLLAKYGVVNVSQLPEIRNKIKDVCLARYGTSTASQFGSSEYVKTMQEKYGVDNAMKLQSTKDKVKSTCLKRYGTECSFQNEEVKDKIRKTCLEKYGVENGGGSKTALEHIKETRERHMQEDPHYLEKINEKRRSTNIEKYGTPFAFQSDIVKQHMQETLYRKYGCSNAAIFKSYQQLLERHDIKPLFTLAEYDSAADDMELEFECLKCHQTFKSLRKHGNNCRCYSCYPRMCQTSIAEKEIAEMFKSCNLNIVENTREVIAPLELDIYIPEKKLAVEFDGLYWHSTACGKDSQYHLSKTDLCEKQGIHLVHVFENEWLTKQEIVRSRLKNLIGAYDNVIFARKCEIRQVKPKTSREFQEQNHVQGAVNSSVNLGLFYENVLVSLMTFSKPRFSKKYEWELVRFCNKLGHHIPGAASKLLKHFERNWKPESLVSYADRRWSQGKLYEALGFQLDHVSPPNYWYFKTCELLQSRVKFQKHRLKSILEKYDDEKTEVENMLLNGYYQIFDCGNLVMVKTHSDKGNA